MSVSLKTRQISQTDVPYLLVYNMHPYLWIGKLKIKYAHTSNQSDDGMIIASFSLIATKNAKFTIKNC